MNDKDNKKYAINDIVTDKLSHAVTEITKMNFEGNVSNNSWFNHIIKPSKSVEPKSDLLAIQILSELVYWYRATEVRDEATGKTIGYKKKFKYDKLQKSYQSLSKKFGQSKLAIKRAIDRLIQLGLITREFRVLVGDQQGPISNIMFIEPIPEKIAEITYSVIHEIPKKVTPSLLLSKEPPHLKVKTYTKSTTKSIITPSDPREGVGRCTPPFNPRKGVERSTPRLHSDGLQSETKNTPPSGSEMKNTPPSGKEPKAPGNLRVIKNHQSDLSKYFTPSGNRQKKLLKILSSPDYKIIEQLPDILSNYELADELDFIVDSLRKTKGVPENLRKKLKALDNIMKISEKDSLLTCISIIQQRNITNSLSYLFKTMEKNKGSKRKGGDSKIASN